MKSYGFLFLIFYGFGSLGTGYLNAYTFLTIGVVSIHLGFVNYIGIPLSSYLRISFCTFHQGVIGSAKGSEYFYGKICYLIFKGVLWISLILPPIYFIFFITDLLASVTYKFNG